MAVMSNDDPLGTLPEASKLAELGRAGISGALQALPFVGGALAEFYDVLWAPAVERRAAEWLRRLGEAVQVLQQQQIALEDLSEDGPFVTAVGKASSIALGTHLEEKLDMLKACVVHMAMPDRPEDFLAMRFLRWVDELSLVHFAVLTYSREPKAWHQRRGLPGPRRVKNPGPHTISTENMLAVGIVDDEAALMVVLGDLVGYRLAMDVRTANLDPEIAWIQPLGRQLLDFVGHIEAGENPA